MVQFEGMEKRMDGINVALKKYGFKNLEEAKSLCDEKGINVNDIVKGVQTICFENAIWAYTLGTAIALKVGAKNAIEAANYIGEGLQAFCVHGSVADHRKVGLGHGNLGAMPLDEKTMFLLLGRSRKFCRS